MLSRPASTTPSRIQNYRTLTYVLTILIYLVFGAAIFDKLESSEESKNYANLTARIAIFRERHNISDQDFRNLTHTVELKIQYRKKQWKFIGSFYYATVVLALIGYGHAIPNTIPGRAVTIAYALIGIPMWLIMIQSVGERLNSLLKVVLKHAKQKLRGCREPKITSMELLTCEAILTVLTVTTASYVFHRCENWLYFDAFYYCLLTLTTIGFGNLVPMQRLDGNVSWPYVLFCILFIFTGLTIVASSGNLLILRFVEANSKRSQHEQHEMEERRRHHVRLIGDVISSNGRLITLEDDENTPSLSVPIGSQRIIMDNSSSNLSLCSCQTQPSLSVCIPASCKKKFKRQQRNLVNSSKQSMMKSRKIRTRTSRQDILHTLRTKNEANDSIVFDKPYLQRDNVRQRSSI